QHIPLTLKAFEMLLVLVENGGHVIDKDQLIRKIWPDTSIEEANLARNIYSLRKILGGEHYIETIPKRGYRFVAGVKEVWSDQAIPLVSEEEERKQVAPTDKAANQLLVANLPDLASVGNLDASSLQWSSVANRVVLPLTFLVFGVGLIASVWVMVSRSSTF